MSAGDGRPAEPAETIIFQHIPKTAGSTFHSILNRRYDEAEIRNVFCSDYSDRDVVELRSLPEEQLRSIRVLKGHMPFGLHRHLPQEARYVTVLREPVARAISQYKYIRRNPGNHLHDQVVGNDLSLGEFVASGISQGMDNGQVRWLAGQVHEWAFGEVTEEELETAKRHVRDHYALVGLTERFDETVLLLADVLGWSGLPLYVRRNVSEDRRDRYDFSEEDVAAVREHHRLDLELYDFACEIFDAQCEAWDVRPERVDRFLRWNGVYSTVMRPVLRLRAVIRRRLP